MALSVKLVRSLSGHIESHRATVRALGLTTLGSSRVLPDTAAVRGMIHKVSYLLEWKETEQAFVPFGRASRKKKS